MHIKAKYVNGYIFIIILPKENTT